MTNTVPRTARAVVVGGGVAGCSTAYHLAKRGWTDVVLVERSTLTSGTTWHAAGLITQARPTSGTREIVQRSLQVFQSLERRPASAPASSAPGRCTWPTARARWEELRRAASAAHGNGIRAELITPDEAVKLFPPLYAGDLVGAVHYPDDGRGNATDTTMALAAGARQLGVTILENTTVTGVLHGATQVTGVSTTAGSIEAGYVVNATGMWGREFGAWLGVRVPLQALAHYYVVTEPIPGLPPGLPTIKAAPEYAYVKNEGAGLMVGFFEPGSYPWASHGIPENAEFTRLPEDWDHLGPYYEQMIKRLPVLADAGIRLHFCGPESFTPDGLYHLGQAAELRNYFVAAGFNSVGFLSGPGAGAVLADWIVDGYPSIDLPETDPRRAAPHEVNRRFLEQRVTETLDLAYEIHWPFQQRSQRTRAAPQPAARPGGRGRRGVRRTARLGAGQLVRARPGCRRQLRVLVRPAELVRALGRGAPRGPRERRASSTRRRSASCWSRAATRRGPAAHLRERRRGPRRAASSTPSG